MKILSKWNSRNYSFVRSDSKLLTAFHKIQENKRKEHGKFYRMFDEWFNLKAFDFGKFRIFQVVFYFQAWVKFQECLDVWRLQESHWSMFQLPLSSSESELLYFSINLLLFFHNWSVRNLWDQRNELVYFCVRNYFWLLNILLLCLLHRNWKIQYFYYFVIYWHHLFVDDFISPLVRYADVLSFWILCHYFHRRELLQLIAQPSTARCYL